MTENERFDHALLNYRSGCKAANNTAFDSAAIYFEVAREMMGPECWDLDQGFAICLYSEEAQARLVTGDLKAMEYLLEQVLSKDIISIRDKFAAYDAKILALIFRIRYCEALSTALKVRNLLGFKFKPMPQKASKIKIFREYFKTKGMSTDDILALPDITDERTVMGQQVMERVSVDKVNKRCDPA